MRLEHRFGGARRQRAGAAGKAIAKIPAALRRRQSESETRKEARGPRERVRLLGKGKLWRVVPGTRAAWNKAAKRRGATETADSQGFVRAACVAGTVERGKNPEDGTDGGCGNPSSTGSALGPDR